MHIPTDKFSVAIRVVRAFSRLDWPEERDIELLRAYYPDQAHLHPDQLALIVINESIEKRKSLRSMALGADVS